MTDKKAQDSHRDSLRDLAESVTDDARRLLTDEAAPGPGAAEALTGQLEIIHASYSRRVESGHATSTRPLHELDRLTVMADAQDARGVASQWLHRAAPALRHELDKDSSADAQDSSRHQR